MSKLYGIGVGVGEPEMITIKAVNTLKKIDAADSKECSWLVKNYYI